MSPEIAVIVGVVAAAAMLVAARLLAPRREMLVYGIGLGITAIAYLFFGLLRGAPAGHLGVELVGAVIYCAAAVLGVRRWPAVMALGWTAHTVWDLFLHHANGPAFAPEWYAMFCVGFDLFIGGYIAALAGAKATSRHR